MASGPSRQRPCPIRVPVRKMAGQDKESLDSSSINRLGNTGAISGVASVAKTYTFSLPRAAGTPPPPHLSPSASPPCPHRAHSLPFLCLQSGLPVAGLQVFGVSEALWLGSNVIKLSLAGIDRKSVV